MKDSRVSTKLFNEWICLTSEYEKTLARIGKDAYQAYLKNEVKDEPTLEICRRITDLFKEARQRREEMEEDFRRTVLAEQAAKKPKTEEGTGAVVPAKQTLGQKVSMGLKQLIFRFFMNRDLENFKGQVQEYSRELGRRAMVCYEVQPVLRTQTHLHLCKLAAQLEKDSDEKWEQILEAHHSARKKGGQSFHLAFVQFAMSFASYAKNTRLKPFFEKVLSYDYAAEANKLKKLYADSHHAEALAVVQKTPDLEEMEVEAGADQLDILERAFAAQPAAIEKLDGTKVEAAPKPAYQPGRSGEFKKVEAKPAAPAPPPAWPPPPPKKEASAPDLAGLAQPEGGRPSLAGRSQGMPQAPPPAPPPQAVAPPHPVAPPEPTAAPPQSPAPIAPPPRPLAPPAASGPPATPAPPLPPPPGPPQAPAAASTPMPPAPPPPPSGAVLRPPPPLETGSGARPPLGERRLSVPRKGELPPLPPPPRPDVKVPELDLDLPPAPPPLPSDRPAPLPPPPRLSEERPPLGHRRLGSTLGSGEHPQVELPPPPVRKEDSSQSD